MKKTHVPCSLKIEEEAVRYDLDNPTKRNTAKLLQLFLTALGYFGSVLVICDLYGTNIRKGIFLPLAIGGFLLASLLQFLPKHSGKLTLGFVLVLLGMSALFSKQIVLGFHAIFNVVYQTAHNTNIAYFQIAKGANITFAATLTGTLVAELLAFLFAFFTIRKPHFTLPTAVSFPACRAGAVSRNPCQRSGNGTASGILGRHAGTAVSGTVGTGEDPLHTAYLRNRRFSHSIADSAGIRNSFPDRHMAGIQPSGIGQAAATGDQ